MKLGHNLLGLSNSLLGAIAGSPCVESTRRSAGVYRVFDRPTHESSVRLPATFSRRRGGTSYELIPSSD